MSKEVVKSSPSGPSRFWADPFDALSEDFDRFFTSGLKRFPGAVFGFRGDGDGRLLAHLDIGETGDELTVEVDAPGVKKEDIDITLAGGQLRVAGKRETHKDAKEGGLRRIEREFGSFERRVTLPCEVDADRIDASLKDGVLTIKLPKSARAKELERKISIRA